MQTDDVNKKRCPPRLQSSGRTHVPTYPHTYTDIRAQICIHEHAQKNKQTNVHVSILQHSAITRFIRTQGTRDPQEVSTRLFGLFRGGRRLSWETQPPYLYQDTEIIMEIKMCWCVRWKSFRWKEEKGIITYSDVFMHVAILCLFLFNR